MYYTLRNVFCSLNCYSFLNASENEHSTHKAKNPSKSSAVEEVHVEYFNDLREKARQERTKGNWKYNVAVQLRVALLSMNNLQGFFFP
jgi:hypothetical protein